MFLPNRSINRLSDRQMDKTDFLINRGLHTHVEGNKDKCYVVLSTVVRKHVAMAMGTHLH